MKPSPEATLHPPASAAKIGKVYRLPARATIEQLQLQVDERLAADPNLTAQQARTAVAELFNFESWPAIQSAIERRSIFNRCDLAAATQMVERDPSWATDELSGWADHGDGAAPLNYMAMLRFDAPRLGLTNDLSGTGEMVRMLIAAGAPVDGQPTDEETPLMTAASYGDVDVANVLIESGADLDRLASTKAGGVPGGSALRHAAVFGMTDVLDAVVRAGAQVRTFVEAAATGNIDEYQPHEATADERIRALIMAADHQRLGVIDRLLEAGTPINGVDQQWRRHPLRLAAQNGRIRSVRHLLSRGADPTDSDDQGLTALDLSGPAHRNFPSADHDEIAKILAELT